MKLPDKLYFVSQRGANVGYGNRGGGIYTILHHALDKKRRLELQGGSVKMYVAEVDWKEV